MAEPTYTINVTSVKTKDVDGVGTVVKQVSYDILVEYLGQTYSEPRIYTLEESSSVLLAGLTKPMMVATIEEKDPTVPGIVKYGKFIIEKELEEQALNSATLPD